MGKGDIRSRRGKIWRGTTGVSRPRKRKDPLPYVPTTRKVKDLKSLKTAVAEPEQKKTAVEAVHPVAEAKAPVTEMHQQPTTENTPVAEVEAGATTAETETPKAKKPRKPIGEKKPAAKKAPAKKAEE